VKKLLVLILLGAGAWFFFHQPAAKWRGMPAAHDPRQFNTDLPKPFPFKGHTVTPLARYSVTAVVLSRERYRNDRAAELSPLDLALGWGPMSVAAVVNKLDISQSGRWYEYRFQGEPPLDPSLIATHSANTHCLPADDAVRLQLLEVKRHDVVTLEGYLVEVADPDGYRWRSSLSREDTRGGSCEVLWVTGVGNRRL